MSEALEIEPPAARRITPPGSLNAKDAQLLEEICNRFLILWDATGDSKAEFAKAVGMSPSMLNNVAAYRNPPSHKAILLAAEKFRLPTDWFYFGIITKPRKARAVPNRKLVNRMRRLMEIQAEPPAKPAKARKPANT